MQERERKLSEREHAVIDSLQNNEMFQRLAIPINPERFPDIRDAEFYVRKDGIIVNAEGWNHPDKKLIGEVMYAPDPNGDQVIFGQKYRKLTLIEGTFTPIPYAERARILAQYDPYLAQAEKNPYFAKYKQIFPREDFVAYLESKNSFKIIMQKYPAVGETISKDIRDADRLLRLDLSGFPIGFTGGLLMGKFDRLHDLDVVFQGSLEENIEIAKKIRDLVKHETQRRVIEGGKGWNIRYYNDSETLMCSFFTYKNPDDAPLKNANMEVISENVTIEGIVSKDIHSIYTPTVLEIENVNNLTKEVSNNIPPEIQLIVYHTATRGECFQGDKIKAKGALVNVKNSNEEYLAICVIEREGVRNITPTWENYYENPEVS